MPANTLTDNPQASHTLAFDQPLIEANNLYFANTLNKDHQIGPANGTRNDGIANEGYHTVIHLVNQLGDPAPVSASELYTKTVSSNSELFYRYGSAPNNVFQLTNNGGTAANPGSSSLIGGILIKFGTITGSPILNGAPVTFLGSFTTAVYSCVITGQTASTADKTINITAGSLTNAGFTVICSGSSNFTSLSYIAIGK